jgi:hypothetical protein
MAFGRLTKPRTAPPFMNLVVQRYGNVGGTHDSSAWREGWCDLEVCGCNMVDLTICVLSETVGITVLRRLQGKGQKSHYYSGKKKGNYDRVWDGDTIALHFEETCRKARCCRQDRPTGTQNRFRVYPVDHCLQSSLRTPEVQQMKSQWMMSGRARRMSEAKYSGSPCTKCGAVVKPATQIVADELSCYLLFRSPAAHVYICRGAGMRGLRHLSWFSSCIMIARQSFTSGNSWGPCTMSKYALMASM